MTGPGQYVRSVPGAILGQAGALHQNNAHPCAGSPTPDPLCPPFGPGMSGRDEVAFLYLHIAYLPPSLPYVQSGSCS